ncbi:MAG: hypothetical protein LUD12_12515 [Lachnospiraceae bacterium]|nr:hypothetical protein [Lachnospiraceae bacterium]
MGMNPIRRDNIMQNMALETNALEHERKRDAGEQKSKGKQRAGKIAFVVLLAVLFVIVAAYVIYHV